MAAGPVPGCSPVLVVTLLGGLLDLAEDGGGLDVRLLDVVMVVLLAEQVAHVRAGGGHGEEGDDDLQNGALLVSSGGAYGRIEILCQDFAAVTLTTLETRRFVPFGATRRDDISWSASSPRPANRTAPFRT